MIREIQLLILAALCCAVWNVFAQTTNSIPQNLYLTDNGKIFWYRSGHKLVDLKAIERAELSKESRPANEDPEGNWGGATNGFQLSLRFEKTIFTNGEPVVATTLMRNVTNVEETYFYPIQIIATKNGCKLEPRNKSEVIEVTVSPMKKLLPQTQCRRQINLNQEYNLSTNGEYDFQAICLHPNITSKIVPIKIATN